MATIYDVAERAGVSPATVSRVLNGKTVKPGLAKLVLAAADQLGYVPSRTARALRRRHSEVIALIIPDIENPFFTSLARGVEDAARESDYSVVLCNSDDDLKKEKQYLEIALSEDMAGVIIAPASAESSVDAFRAKGRQVVAVDRPVNGCALDTVMLDNFTAARDATAALWNAGYRRIACITGPTDVLPAAERARGWREFMQEQLPDFPTADYLRTTNFRVLEGREMMTELASLESPPDAVVAANNMVGVGVLQILSETKSDPPSTGVSVIGDLPFSTSATNNVPVVHLPTRHMGMTAARLLVKRIQGVEDPVSTVVLHGSITADR